METILDAKAIFSVSILDESLEEGENRYVPGHLALDAKRVHIAKSDIESTSWPPLGTAPASLLESVLSASDEVAESSSSGCLK